MKIEEDKTTLNRGRIPFCENNMFNDDDIFESSKMLV